MMKTRNFFGHLKTVLKHKWVVLKLCIKCGLLWRGLVHDLSKFSYTEFSEGIKYYNGKRSPNGIAKEEYGYSKAWLHHKGRNKHHHEYWYDPDAPNPYPFMPFNYFVEHMCDDFAAGIVYKGKEWYPGFQLEYFNRRKKYYKISKEFENATEEVMLGVSKNGLKVLNKKYLKNIYDKYNK